MLRLGVVVAVAALCGCHEPKSYPDPCALDQPGSGWIAFVAMDSGRSHVWRVRSDGTCRLPVTTDSGDDVFPAWLGTESVGFSSTRTSGVGIYVHSFAYETDEGVPVLGATAVTSPAWSPAGIWAAFEGRAQGASRSDVYVVLANGGMATALTAGTVGNSAGPIWSHDGARIFFVSNRTGVYQVYSMAADGSDLEGVTTGTRNVLGRAAISPDAKKLAFSRSDGARPVIYVRDLESGAEDAISGTGNSDSDPAFDATGDRLAVSRVHGSGSPAIWIIDVAGGGNAVQVTTPPAGAVDGQPAFRPE